MKNSNYLYYVTLSVLVGVVFCLFCGCEETLKTQGAAIENKPIFYPPAPDRPRLQYLMSIAGTDDIGGGKKVGGFEQFIVGDADPMGEVTDIAKPYGFAIFEGKLYVCDLDRKALNVLDLKDATLKSMTGDGRLANPGTIWIDEGIKYVADPTAKVVFVFGRDNKLIAIWGREWEIEPIDVAVQGENLYILDGENSQVLVLNKKTGQLLSKLGKYGDETGQLKYVTGLAVDREGNVYISDKIRGIITKLNSEGIYQQTIGFRGDNIHALARPKGLAIDKEDRIWVIDALASVVKIFDSEGRLLLYFGFSGIKPGNMYLPAVVRLDYDNVELFQKYAAEGSQLEFLVLVSNQFGPNKISVYGFGRFPEQEKAIEKAMLEELKRREELQKEPAREPE